MKKFTAILLILSLFFLLAACTVTSPDMSLSPSIPLPTKATINDQPAPPQSLPFKSLEEAKAFILDPQSSTTDFMEYAELENAHFTMIDKFKSEGYLPYVLVDGGILSSPIELEPQNLYEEAGCCNLYEYNDKQFVTTIRFIEDQYQEAAKLGYINYQKEKFNTGQNEYENLSFTFGGKDTVAITYLFSGEKNAVKWIGEDNENKESYTLCIVSYATHSEIIDFIEHMSIEKFSLA